MNINEPKKLNPSFKSLKKQKEDCFQTNLYLKLDALHAKCKEKNELSCPRKALKNEYNKDLLKCPDIWIYSAFKLIY